MLTKFDSKSNRVKGLSFHPKRPWILASLHNGAIQLWDFRMGVLIDKFEEHEGPVRGVDFHKSQPLFVSGGDDYKIKVWNYKLRRCLFTLLGHLDYIRTVCFHHEYPWIVSASDDQTIRIWNWQSRNCISVLTGHNHYVMCANFHPRDDLIVSASLDQTVRVWDVSGLRRKTVRGAPTEDSAPSRTSADIFGQNDAVVKYVLEGHDRGVNWAVFHPTSNLIASGADDRLIKLWRMTEGRAWELDTLRGHTNNVSCVMFHAKHDLIVSDSEDRSIRVWDVQKRMCLQTFRRENDRFWMLGVHPEQALIAAGHDSGMVVFKLERERPAYATSTGSTLFYVKDRYLRRAVLGSGTDVPLASMRSRTGGSSSSPLGAAPRSLISNPFSPVDDAILVLSAAEGGQYELYALGGTTTAEQDPTRGPGVAACFTARNKFCVLEKSRQLVLRGFTNDAGKRIRPPYTGADFIFPASTSGRVLVRSEDRICLFELQSRRVVAEITGVVVKYVAWSADGGHVALMGKHAVVLADRDLTQVCSITETVRVKSGCWDESGVFIYTTLNHVKYVLPIASGDHGIVRTLDAPVYATECRGNILYVLDRECKNRAIPVDATEHMFKLAIARRQFDKVLAVIKSGRLCGHAVIAYLQRAGYPEVALFFVEDELTRFNLALECGNLEVALKAAKAVGSEAAWARLAQEALRQGNFEVVELAYQTVKAMDKLSFLYLITGNTEKLTKMLAIANLRGDATSRFHTALLLGDVVERVKVLEGAGQTALAYATAATHGLTEDADRLRGYLESAGLPVPDLPNAGSAVALLPPTPIYRNSTSWPTIAVARAAFDPAAVAAMAAAASERATDAAGGQAAAAAAAASLVAAAAAAEAKAAAEAAAIAAAANRAARQHDGANAGAVDAAEPDDGGWDDGLDLGPEEDRGLGGKASKAGAASEGGAWGDDLDLGPDEPVTGEPSTGHRAAAWAPPAGGTSIPSYWVQNSTVAGDHVAAGSFETAMQLLNRQVGIVNFAPLKAAFLSGYEAARASVPTLPGAPPASVFLTRNDRDAPPPRERSLPVTHATLAALQERVQALARAFQDGRFGECRDVLESLLTLIPLVVVFTKQEVTEVKSILKMAQEYKLAVRIMLTARAHDQADAVRQMELAAYMTHCALEPPHLMLACNLAMVVTYKHSNFIHAAGFARRLLEMPDINSARNAQLAAKAKKVLQLSEAQARNTHRINYDDSAPFTICAETLVPVLRGGELVKCPYCGAAFVPAHRGRLCSLDGMAQVGLETLGLVCSSVQSR